MRVTPERSDAMSDPIKAYARAVAEATRKYLYVTQTADVPMLDEHDLQAIIATVPAPDVRPKWCNVHQHHKWCEHNGGVMGPTGYAAPDVQAQMIASLSEQVHDMRKGHQAQIDAAVAREREECAKVAEWVWDSGNQGAHGGEQANRTTAAIRARSAKGIDPDQVQAQGETVDKPLIAELRVHAKCYEVRGSADEKSVDAVFSCLPVLLDDIERVQAQIEAAVARERDRVIGIFVGELQKLHEKTVLDCGDNSCLFATRRGGMRTNGGCRCIERLLDAAVARERERIIELVELKRAKFNIGTRASLALNDVLDQIRARSAKGV